MYKILFGDLRKIVSVIDKVSICNRKTLDYENFTCIKNVPTSYDNYFVCGVGVIESEFGDSFAKCIEIMISEIE